MLAYIKLPITSTFIDYPDNESNAIIVFFMGCPHECDGCQNPEFKKYSDDGATKIDVNGLYSLIINGAKKYRTNKVVLSGGDPLASYNIKFVKCLLESSIDLDYCIYTGYEIDRVTEYGVSGFKFIKTGRFVKSLSRTPEKTNEKMVLASSNQKFYDENLLIMTTDGILYLDNER